MIAQRLNMFIQNETLENSWNSMERNYFFPLQINNNILGEERDGLYEHKYKIKQKYKISC